MDNMGEGQDEGQDMQQMQDGNDQMPEVPPMEDMDNMQHQDGEQPDEGAAPMQFTDEEIQNLKEIFDLFDKDHKGSINIKDLEAIMQSLQRDPAEAMNLL